MSVVPYIRNLPPRFDPASFILFDSQRRFMVSFFLPAPFLQLPSRAIVFRHLGRSRLYFVFHQARIHSDAKQWKASTFAPLSPSLLGSLTPRMRLRRSALRRSRRIPERRTVEKHVFTLHSLSLLFSLSLFHVCDLLSISSPCGAVQEKGCFELVPKRGGLLFIGSSRFQMQMHTATKDATKGVGRNTHREAETSQDPRFATSHPIYPPGCSGPWNVSRYRGVRFSAPDASRSCTP